MFGDDGLDLLLADDLLALGFDQKHLAIMEGEKAALGALPLIRSKLQKASGK